MQVEIAVPNHDYDGGCDGSQDLKTTNPHTLQKFLDLKIASSLAQLLYRYVD